MDGVDRAGHPHHEMIVHEVSQKRKRKNYRCVETEDVPML